MTERPDRTQSGGALTGATGDLTPDEIQRDFEPGEWREASGSEHQGEVTQSQASRAPAQQGEVGDPGGELETGGPTNMATRESGYGSEAGLNPDDPAYRMERRPEPAAGAPHGSRPERGTRLGGDERRDAEEHL